MLGLVRRAARAGTAQPPPRHRARACTRRQHPPYAGHCGQQPTRPARPAGGTGGSRERRMGPGLKRRGRPGVVRACATAPSRRELRASRYEPAGKTDPAGSPARGPRHDAAICAAALEVLHPLKLLSQNMHTAFLAPPFLASVLFVTAKYCQTNYATSLFSGCSRFALSMSSSLITWKKLKLKSTKSGFEPIHPDSSPP